MEKAFFLLLAAVCAVGGFAQTPEQLRSWLPPVAGWTIDENVEVFGPGNLFDRINGAAPLFLENNFREMTSMEYKRGEDYITIQAYRHATPQDAFGMYSSERSSELEFYPIGGEAQGDASNLFLFAGHIYIKMWTHAEGDVSGTLHAIGRALAERIDPAAAYPVVLRSFPAEGEIPYSEAYTTSSFIGHEFLKRVYSARYDGSDGRPFQAFVVEADDPSGAGGVLKSWFAFTGQPQEVPEGLYTVTDRYNGDIPVLWRGRYLIGIFSPDGNPTPGAEAFIRTVADRLPQ